MKHVFAVFAFSALTLCGFLKGIQPISALTLCGFLKGIQPISALHYLASWRASSQSCSMLKKTSSFACGHIGWCARHLLTWHKVEWVVIFTAWHYAEGRCRGSAMGRSRVRGQPWGGFMIGVAMGRSRVRVQPCHCILHTCIAWFVNDSLFWIICFCLCVCTRKEILAWHMVNSLRQ